MRTFTEIVSLIKEIRNLKKDKEIAKLLSIEYKTLATAKSRNSIPYKELITFCSNEQVSLNWLLNNEGSKELREISEEYNSYSDPELVEIIKVLRENPSDKKFVLKLLKGKKDVKEALEGLFGKSLLNDIDVDS